MLIEFSVSNYRSISKKQTFSLVASKGNELLDLNTFTLGQPSQMTFLRSAAVYGANASGKSNLFRALDTMRSIVVDSASDYQRGDKLPVEPFLFDAESSKQPTEFEVIFIQDGVRYQYGFSSTRERVIEEWLIAFPKGRAQRLFGRQWDKEKEQYNWEMGNNLQGEKLLWQKTTRGNALFLSTAVQLNSEKLEPIFDWFNIQLKLKNVVPWSGRYSADLCLSERKKSVLEFLQAADLDIHDISIEKEKFDKKSLPADMSDSMKDIISSNMEGEDMYDIKTIHNTSDGKLVPLEISEESDGTQKLFALAGPWIDSLKNGYVVFIDELHDNLHPNLVKFLVKLFHNNKTNVNNAQLVFTTHETSILNQDIFRRDQIWFCEKDEAQSTSLYPLTDFSPRKGRENLEVAYLSGRYGALPYVREIESM